MGAKRKTTRKAATKAAARGISLEEFTAETYSAVLRAVRNRGGKQVFPGPLVFGLIWWPDGPGGAPSVPLPAPKPR